MSDTQPTPVPTLPRELYIHIAEHVGPVSLARWSLASHESNFFPNVRYLDLTENALVDKREVLQAILRRLSPDRLVALNLSGCNFLHQVTDEVKRLGRLQWLFLFNCLGPNNRWTKQNDEEAIVDALTQLSALPTLLPGSTTVSIHKTPDYGHLPRADILFEGWVHRRPIVGGNWFDRICVVLKTSLVFYRSKLPDQKSLMSRDLFGGALKEEPGDPNVSMRALTLSLPNKLGLRIRAPPDIYSQYAQALRDAIANANRIFSLPPPELR